ncbi:MAG: ATP-binding cassette domain-containing protein [Thermoplasmata archaeon]|nr:ATP-binding cassette domain-containing protein [Thermoplasmata archaeon]
MAGEIARADHLEVEYGGHVVWSDANFRIQRGELVAVIGPNGAGKTTLFRLLLGLIRPSRGDLRVFEEAPRRGNRKIGYVPQSHAVDRDTNVEAVQLVRLGFSGNRWVPNITPRGIRAERSATDEALRSVGATELAKKSLGAMSGGELQRIFLAEALAGSPELLLLDEPLASLDLRRAKELVDLVDGLVRTRNVATLLVAHDINPLIHCLDKVIYIANGQVATGLPSEVLTTESLSALYGVRVEVLHDSRGNMVIVGGEDSHPDSEP